MQAQATGTRRFGLNRLTAGAAAIGLLATSAIGLSTLDTVDLPFTGGEQASRSEIAVPNYFSSRLGEGLRANVGHDAFVPNYASPLLGEGRLNAAIAAQRTPSGAHIMPGMGEGLHNAAAFVADQAPSGAHIAPGMGEGLRDYVSTPSSQDETGEIKGPGEGLR